MKAPRDQPLKALFLFLLCGCLVLLVLVYNFNIINLKYAENLRGKRTENGSVVILYWSTIFGSVPKFNKYESCPVYCEWTSDHKRAEDADAMVVHARDAYPLPGLANKRNVPLVLHTQENPVYTPVLVDPRFMAHFTYLWSYRLDSDFYEPVFSKPLLSPPIPFSQKSGMVFAAFSNCEVGRTAYLKELMKHITVDSYGACLNNKQGLVARYQSLGSKHFKDHKVDMMRNYKFSLVFFNQDCDYFVDDQLQHAWNAGSVPVFMGTDKIGELLFGNLKSSIIKVKDFKSPKLLAEYLHMLSQNEQLYEKYFRWKNEGFQFPPSYNSSKVAEWWESPFSGRCRICIAIKNSTKPITSRLKPIPCRARTVEDYLE